MVLRDFRKDTKLGKPKLVPSNLFFPHVWWVQGQHQCVKIHGLVVYLGP